MNKEDYIETPFDDQIFLLENDQLEYKNNLSKEPLEKNRIRLFNNLDKRTIGGFNIHKLLAILYNLRSLHLRLIKANIVVEGESNTRILASTQHSHTKAKDTILEVVQAYCQYVEYLNQIKRDFDLNHSSLGLKIPLEWRISFYRNKIIEHWEDYQAITITAGIIRNHIPPPPYKLASIMVPEHRKPAWEKRSEANLFNELKNEFLKFGISLPNDFMSQTYVDRSETIYSYLETLNLPTKKSSKTEGVTKALINLSFPIPITDPEKYSKLLATELCKIK